MGIILAIKVGFPNLNLFSVATSKAYFLHARHHREPIYFHLPCADVASKDAQNANYHIEHKGFCFVTKTFSRNYSTFHPGEEFYYMRANNWDLRHMVKCDIYSALYNCFSGRAANILSKKDHISLCVKENKSRSRGGHQAHGIILVLTITDDGYRIMMMGRNRCANRAL